MATATVVQSAETQVVQVAADQKAHDGNQNAAQEGQTTIVAEEQQAVVTTETADGKTSSTSFFNFRNFKLFAPKQKKNEIKVKYDVPVGAVARVQLRGTIDRDTHDCDITASVKPLIGPAVKVGSLKGNLDEGITSEFKVAAASGSITLYQKENKLWVKARVEVAGKSNEVDVGLISIA